MAVFVSGAAKIPFSGTFVNYIQSSGTQYIDTEVTGGANASLEMTARMVATNSVNNNQFFGYKGNFVSINGPKSLFRTEDDANHTVTFTTTPTQKWTLKIDSNGNHYCDGVLCGTIPHIAGRGWGDGTYGNWVFCTANDGITYAAVLELYSLKMYTNGVPVRDFRPCYDPDGVVCLYDMVDKKFFYNSGTGAFIAG